MEAGKLDSNAIWLATPQSLDSGRFNHVLRKHPDMDVVDEARLKDEEYALWEKFGVVMSERQPLPTLSPPLTLNFPAKMATLPDFFWLSAGWFCSARLRAAFALPSDVIQYIPVTIISSDPAVHAMEYQLVRVLVGQSVVDLERSDLRYKKEKDRFIGGKYISIKFRGNFIVREGFHPQAELLHAAENTSSVFATDSLAERVMKAGCLGLAFQDPSHVFQRPGRLIRTARGVELDDSAARRAHLRLVKQTRAAQAAAAGLACPDRPAAFTMQRLGIRGQ